MTKPQLVTVTDELLSQILGTLGQIRDRLPAPPVPAPTAGPVELREPEQPVARSTARGRRTTRGGGDGPASSGG